MIFAEKAIPILELGILALSLFIVTTTAIDHILKAYRWQTFLLLLTALGALLQNWGQFNYPMTRYEEEFVVALMAWPIFLIWIIARALTRATISENTWGLTDEDWMDIYRAWADASFRRGKPTPSRMGVSMIIYLFLVVFAFVVAFRFPPSEPVGVTGSRIGLGVAMSLEFAGLFTLISKREIISQVIGLFVMDHGMFLGIILLVPMPTPLWDFLIALYLYTFITLLLLFFLLPNLRRIKSSIDLDVVKQESQLKG